VIHRYEATVGDRAIAVTVEPLDGERWRVVIDGRTRVWSARRVDQTTWSLLPDEGGAARLVDLDAVGADLVATVAGASFPLKLGDARRAALGRAAPSRVESGPLSVRAPMPGKLIKLHVKPGDAVSAGQGVAVVEAMKMENELKAPRDGKVAEVKVQEGQPVEAGQILVTIA